MQKTTCSQLRLKLAEIKTLKNDFDLELGRLERGRNREQIRKLKKELERKIENLNELLCSKEIKVTYVNPETGNIKEIKINILEQIGEWRDFYLEHMYSIPDEYEFEMIWKRYYKEIEEEIKLYGYDKILLIPEKLPKTATLHGEMTKGYLATSGNGAFDYAGDFDGVRHCENRKTRIILCHNDQNIDENPEANFFLKATLGKSYLELSGLTKAEAQDKIQKNENIFADFEIEFDSFENSGKSQQIKVRAEGLSLNEYLLFQRQYFEKEKKHLDEAGGTLLLKTNSRMLAVSIDWSSALRLSSGSLKTSEADFGCRLARSFSL
jgi:hypothetical protein